MTGLSVSLLSVEKADGVPLWPEAIQGGRPLFVFVPDLVGRVSAVMCIQSDALGACSRRKLRWLPDGMVEKLEAPST